MYELYLLLIDWAYCNNVLTAHIYLSAFIIYLCICLLNRRIEGTQ